MTMCIISIIEWNAKGFGNHEPNSEGGREVVSIAQARHQEVQAVGAYGCILEVSQTIADWTGRKQIGNEHISENAISHTGPGLLAMNGRTM